MTQAADAHTVYIWHSRQGGIVLLDLLTFAPSLDAKLDAVELLLHSFSSAATFLNPQATRCACLYSLNFDPSGTLVGTAIQVSFGEISINLSGNEVYNWIVVPPSPHLQTYLLERNRICQRQLEEGNFNIFHQLLLGADDELTSDLMLDAPIETEDANLYCEELDDVSYLHIVQ